jgi:hypothetical protein
MPDTRQKNTNWLVTETAYGGYGYEAAHTALLMDIRDELQQLNRVFACYNFQRIPALLQRISANTYRPKAKRKKNPFPI